MERRNFLQTLTIGVGLLCSGACVTESVLGAEAKKDDEKLTPAILKKMLYTKNKKEEEYIDDIFRMYEKKVITKKILYGAYEYALRKKNTVRMLYFAKSLEALCRMSKLRIKFKTF